MKKVMWIISVLSLVLDAAALQFLPDTVPMHYNPVGEIDRWGSKYETLVFPAVILAFALFWQLFISHYEKQAANAAAEKARAEAVSTAKVMKIAGTALAAMLTVLEGFILYGAYREANIGATHASIDTGKVACFLGGAVCIVLGNFMPKAKKNRWVGVRVRWSMYNDVTWMKSNRCGAFALVAAGLASILTGVFAAGAPALVLMLIYLLTAITATLIYTHRVYRQELSRTDA